MAKQGSPLSTFLFNLVWDDLITSLQDSCIGATIGSDKIAVMASADDIVISAESSYGLQAGLNLSNKISSNLGMSINARKCSLSVGTLRIVRLTSRKL